MKSVSFDLDPNSKVKLYFQLYKKLSEQISLGQIPAGTKLPSVRIISTQLNISRNTVTKAYEMLQNDGFIIAKEKSGFFAASVMGTDGEKRVQPAVSQQEAEEDDSIPTVENVFKQRMGSFANFDSDELLELSKGVTESFNRKEEEDQKQEIPQEEIIPETASTSQELSQTAEKENFEIPTFSEQLEEDFSEHEEQEGEEEISNSVPEQEQKISDIPETTESKLLKSFTKVLLQNQDWENVERERFGQYELRVGLAQYVSLIMNEPLSPEQILVGDNPTVFINHVLSTIHLEHTPQKLERKGLLQMATQAAKNTTEPRKIQAAVFSSNELIHDIFNKNSMLEEVKIFKEMSDEALEILASQDTLLLYADETAPVTAQDPSKKIAAWMNSNQQTFFIQNGTEINVSKMVDMEKVAFVTTFDKLIHKSLGGAIILLPESITEEFSSHCHRCHMSLVDQYAISDFLISMGE